MTGKLSVEEFGNLVKFCEQKYRLSDEEVKVIVMEFSEEQVKELSNVSEKARMYLKEKLGITPFEFIRFNEPGSMEQLNKAFEK